MAERCIFQDVDALPLEAQTILLNVLELGIVQRMNSSRPIPVDVRVLASSSEDLERLIEQGSFKPDLYYRLSSFEIRLPALRERMEDLPFLIDNILKRLSSCARQRNSCHQPRKPWHCLQALCLAGQSA